MLRRGRESGRASPRREVQKEKGAWSPAPSGRGHKTAFFAITLHGVWQEKSLYGRKFMGIVRSTFVIGPDGKLQAVYDNVKVKGHAEAVLECLK